MTAITNSSICRFCSTACPVTVEVENGRATRVSGSKHGTPWSGFCCTRGQAAPEQIEHADRLLQSQRRMPDGSFAAIGSEAAMDEIAARLKDIIDRHGPESVAMYLGTYTTTYPATSAFTIAFTRAIQSPMVFTANTIDQPGKDVANALIGGWDAGPQAFAGSDVWMILGANPLVSLAVTLPGQNPGKRLTDAIAGGMKFIVVDPRRTVSAARAHIHLQPRPGEDASILAGMIRIIIAEGLYDKDFVAENVDGLQALAAATEPFGPDFVAARAGIEADDLILAAQTFAQARRGLAVGATGVNMSGRSSLTEYLILALNTICGRYLRAGEEVINPGVLLPRAMPKAQPRPPRPASGYGKQLSTRGLGMAACGMPTAAVADEILAGNIRALFTIAGNPVAAWPDQHRTIEALKAIELFVQIDIKMTPSAKLADYVIAPKISYEVPTTSHTKESMELFSPVAVSPEPFGLYAPALLDPPPGSDLIEEWQLLFGLAKRLGLGLTLNFPNRVPGATREYRKAVHLDMERDWSTDDILEILCQGSRIPLSEVKRHPHGAYFPERILVQPKDADCDVRMMVGDPGIMAELAEVRAEPPLAERQGSDFPLLLISRRAAHVYNSTGRDLPKLYRKGLRYNPAYMHPDDIAELGLENEQEITIESRHGAIAAVVGLDATLRRGLVSMSHAFGDLPAADLADVRRNGSSTGALISVEDDFDRYSGIPRMSAIPVRLRAVGRQAAASGRQSVLEDQ